MKKCVLFLCFLMCTLKSEAKYEPLTLNEMIVSADKIVYGKIISLDTHTFTLKIENSVTGDKGVVVVQRFKDWLCAFRWTEYQIGQRLFLFLQIRENKLYTLSAGNEGELPVVNQSVYFKINSIPVVPSIAYRENLPKEPFKFTSLKEHNVYGNPYFGVEWDLKDFFKTTAVFRKCFSFRYNEKGLPVGWETKCNNDKLSKLAKQHKLLNYLFGMSRNE